MVSRIKRVVILGSRRRLVPYNIDFTALPDGNLPSIWNSPTYSPTWVIDTGEAINEPTYGANLVSNSDFETGDPPNGWIGQNNAILSANADVRPGSTGIQSINCERGTGDTTTSRPAGVATDGRFSYAYGWGKNINAATAASLVITGTPILYIVSQAATDWLYGEGTVLGTVYSEMRLSVVGNAGEVSRFDDAANHIIDQETLFALLPKTTSEVICRANWNITENFHAGVIVNADSRTNPKDYVIALFRRSRTNPTRVELLKYVNNVITEVMAVNTAYVAGASVEVRKSGTTYQVYYNDIQVGADQTINDVEIIHNGYHGMFSTGGASGCDAFFLERS